MKRRILTRAGTFAGAALLALTAPALAQAATGLFEFTTADGVQEQYVNPQDNTCYNIDASGPVRNRTDRDAHLYTGFQCRGDELTLKAGENAPSVDAKSLNFPRP
ncbi:hypothetical protein [Kitasatospora sp. NPDC094011]|uniref:hypothetical protein n=1 Tax=Kitasatospora sp. NPDC094011 TaxID=3364090 RepID=UPI0038257DAB